MSETTVRETAGRPLAVVTGASSGIGRELAVQFAENGYDLVVAAEDDRIGPATGSFAEHGIQAVPVQADLAGGLRGAHGRQGPRDRRVREEQGPGDGRPGSARDREGGSAGTRDQAGQRRIAPATPEAPPDEGVRL